MNDKKEECEIKKGMCEEKGETMRADKAYLYKYNTGMRTCYNDAVKWRGWDIAMLTKRKEAEKVKRKKEQWKL